MRLSLPVRPLTPEAYAPYGDVISDAPPGNAGRPVNEGYARRFDRVASVENLRPGASLNLAMFRVSPRPMDGFLVKVLERHVASTQVFVPMRARRYLVVAALGADRPDLSTLAAFMAHGEQGVSYRPGVWHLPMIVLDEEALFACVVNEDGGPDDCDVAWLPEAEWRELAGLFPSSGDGALCAGGGQWGAALCAGVCGGALPHAPGKRAGGLLPPGPLSTLPAPLSVSRSAPRSCGALPDHRGDPRIRHAPCPRPSVAGPGRSTRDDEPLRRGSGSGGGEVLTPPARRRRPHPPPPLRKYRRGGGERPHPPPPLRKYRRGGSRAGSCCRRGAVLLLPSPVFPERGGG